ncbi:O-antigen ligase family protein [Dictyoglomus thermophilum]|uniref:O-Antigen Polymerase family n=1 Tax=Dictyoglomus thermophilum (strain ATCC 35947 / DSM 3960 / H-6-12) TaxID=309799 RepID=B5YBL5_DICT6|nr:O-antigen ligase family protein [Dictyoglomus thermophilum]ACI20096.1 O-Antigen Polymerase family [Dictyoglomus thermophilum H-6-12]
MLIEKLGTVLSSFSYFFQIPFALYLTSKVKNFWEKFFEDRQDKIILGLLFISGIISSLLSVKKLEAFLASLIPFVFVWFYVLGKHSIKLNIKSILYYILIGSSMLGFVLVFSKLLDLSWYIGSFAIFDGKVPRGLVMGVKAQGLALLLEFGILAGLGLLIIEKDKKSIFKILFLLIFCIIGFMIAETRGGILGLIFGFLTILFSEKSFREIKKRLGFVLIILLLLLVLFFTVFNQFSQRLSVALEKGRVGSIYERVYIYLGTLRMIKDHLLFGVGPGCFVYVYPEYALKDFPYIPEELKEELANAVTTHNIYLYFLSGWGIMGTFLFFWWLFRKIYKGMKYEYSFEKHLILAILMVYFGHIILDDLFSIHIPLLIGILNRKGIK